MIENTRALLFGLGEELAGDLAGSLESCGVSILGVCDRDSAIECRPDVLFCSADTELVRRLRISAPDAAVVVVSRHPEVSDWLDSMEAGATDYCAAPFEPSQLLWILQGTLHPSRAAA